MAFQTFSKTIAENYLGTVAYVDDLIFTRKVESKPERILVPDMKAAAAKVDAGTSETADLPLVIPTGERQFEPNIDPLLFTKSFCEKGIHCALLEITEEGEDLVHIKKTLSKSDIVILDWQMHGDNGAKAIELVNFIVTADQGGSPALRLIVIYTDQPTINSIIPDHIKPIFDELHLTSLVSQDNLSIFSGYTKVISFQKFKRVVGGGHEGVDVKDFPDRIILEFTEMTKGLVSNTALQSISILKHNTHKFLGTFNKDLDCAYLAHRAMLPNPEDSQIQLRELIIGSFNSILYYSKISDICSIEHIKEWLDDSEYTDQQIGVPGPRSVVPITNNERFEWLRDGYKIFTNNLLIKNNKPVLDEKKLDEYDKTTLLTNTQITFIPDGKTSSEDFAILTHHKSNFKSLIDIPMLTLGILIKENISGDYLLCIQQRCDSVRLVDGEKRNFLFLPLVAADKKFSILYKDNQGLPIKLKVIADNCHNLITKKFEQTENGFVLAKNDGSFYFQDADGKRFEWILELKEAHAQRIANKFAAQLSRVGLDESEWLRRS